MEGISISLITTSDGKPGRMDAVKSGASSFLISSSVITCLAICRRFAARSCRRANRSSISAIRPFSPEASASSAKAARITARRIS
jgi:hypothetical protein